MLVSSVETGLRLATPTVVCAARWKTVAISYSPSARSSASWSRTSPRTTRDPIEQAAGDQLRPRHPVADQRHDVGARGQQLAHQPAAEEARRAGDEAPAGPARTTTRRQQGYSQASM